MTDREEAAARGALEAAAKAAVGYIHPDPRTLPGHLFATAQIQAIDPAQFRTDRKDGHE